MGTGMGTGMGMGMGMGMGLVEGARSGRRVGLLAVGLRMAYVCMGAGNESSGGAGQLENGMSVYLGDSQSRCVP